MSRKLLLALVLILLPILGRGLFYYQGWYGNKEVATPDYASFQVPTVPAQTSLTVDQVVQSTGIVVIDTGHYNQFNINELQPLTTALAQRGMRVELDGGGTTLATRLRYASAYIVISPTDSFLVNELRLVRDFVTDGGRLLVLTDATRGSISFDYFGALHVYPDVNGVNPLLAPYGLTFEDDYLYNLQTNEGNFRNVIFTAFPDLPFTSGLNQVVFYGAHSIRADKGSQLTVGDANTYSSKTDSGGGLSAAAISADGNVLAIGDFTFMMQPYNQVADNGFLLEKVADFIAGGTRIPRLANVPYSFGNAVHLVVTSDVQLTADLLSAIGSLQAALEATDRKLMMDNLPPNTGDKIVLGTLIPDDDLLAYLKPFKLELDEFSSFVEIPGFGKVGKEGNGFLFFSPSASGNTLVLLTDYVEDLPSLISLVGQGDLSSCILQGQMGVCSIGYGGSFDEEPSYFPDPALTPTPVP